jgi:hypothetical protein
MKKVRTKHRTANKFDRLAKSSPTTRTRAVYFVVGAVLGGVLG